MLKSKIRKEIKQKLTKLDDAQRLRKSHLIKNKLFNLAEFKRARCIMFYIATDKEVETNFMISAAQKIGKKIAVPAILVREKRMMASILKDLKTELAPGPYGILQPKREYLRPAPKDKIDLVVVPGLAFGQGGRRLGRGRGYYDKFLAGLCAHIPRIGLAFDFQVLNDLPAFSHDIPATKVISA